MDDEDVKAAGGGGAKLAALQKAFGTTFTGAPGTVAFTAKANDAKTLAKEVSKVIDSDDKYNWKLMSSHKSGADSLRELDDDDRLGLYLGSFFDVVDEAVLVDLFGDDEKVTVLHLQDDDGKGQQHAIVIFNDGVGAILASD